MIAGKRELPCSNKPFCVITRVLHAWRAKHPLNLPWSMNQYLQRCIGGRTQMKCEQSTCYISNEICSRFFLPDPFNACLSSLSSLSGRERPFRLAGSRRSIVPPLTFSSCRRHIIGALTGGASCPPENHGTNRISLMRGRVPPIIHLHRSLKVTWIR